MKKELIAHLERETGLQREQLHTVFAALATLTNNEPEAELPDGHTIDEVERYWHCFADAVAAGRLTNKEDYMADGVRVSLIWSKAYPAYEVHYRHRYGREGIPKGAMIAKLKAHAAFVTMVDSLRIGETRTSAYIFDQTLLQARIPRGTVR